MKNLSKTMLAVLAVGLLSCSSFICQQAQATQINATINFSGSVTLSKNPAMMTSSLVFTGPVSTTLSTGDFASIPVGTNADFFENLTFNDNTLEVINSPFLFWELHFGGNVYQFLLEPGNPYFLTSGNVTLGHGGPNPSPWSFTMSGPGSLAASGFDDTFGTFTLSGTGTAANLVFAGSFSAVSAPVPDSGTTLALLGLALAVVEVLRRQFKAA
jgi:protein with PEP-CTERM/exosortase system signal